LRLRERCAQSPRGLMRALRRCAGCGCYAVVVRGIYRRGLVRA
jgi:hypothetical protein